MSRFDDDWAVMDDSWDEHWSAGPHGAVAQFVDDLRSLGDGEPPEPTAELARVLAGAEPLPHGRPGRTARTGPRRSRVVGLVAASVLVGSTGVAAASGRLPEPAQRFVSDVVNNLTPFTVPAGSGNGSEPLPPPAPSLLPSAPVRRHPLRPAPEPRDATSEPRDEPGPGGGSDSSDGSGGSDGAQAPVDGGSSDEAPTHQPAPPADGWARESEQAQPTAAAVPEPDGTGSTRTGASGRTGEREPTTGDN